MNEQGIQCVGLIMDGNRRWAQNQGLNPFEGHRAGYNKLTEVVGWACSAGIPHLIVYAFSEENWRRTEEEVGHLMKLFRYFIEHEGKRLLAEEVRVRFVGDRARFSEDIQKGMERVESMTGKDFRITLYLAVSYGGRAEILAAANALIFENAEIVSEEEFSKKLWSYPMPDPDLIIRTGGEQRLSGFLPWQSVYSELFFTETLWPDFSPMEFERIVADFHTRERRYGK